MPGGTVYRSFMCCIFAIAAFFFGADQLFNLKSYSILRPLEIYIEHGGSIRRDLHRVGSFEREVLTINQIAGQRARGFVQRQLLAGRARQNLGREDRVFLVIGIFAPIDDGVAHRRAIPQRIEDNILRRRDRINLPAIIPGNRAPARETIAIARGFGHTGKLNRLTLIHITGLHFGAALGVKGDPIAGRGDGIDIGIRRYDRIRRKDAAVYQLPARNAGVGRHIVRGKRNLIIVVRRRLLRSVHIRTRIRRHEVYIENIRKLRNDLARFRLGIIGQHSRFIGSAIFLIIPAVKLLASLQGRRGRSERRRLSLRLVDNLIVNHCFVVVEFIGDVDVRIPLFRVNQPNRLAVFNDLAQRSYG